MRADWSQAEVEAIVSDYLDMLAAELGGLPYSKSAHRRRLARLLAGRSDGSIERKHQNISAVLINLGCPYISGYKPLRNYQAMLFDVIRDRIAGHKELLRTVAEVVESPAVLPQVEDVLGRLEDPPAPVQSDRVRENPKPPRVLSVNYLSREAANMSLGRAGEEFVVGFERARLLASGREQLAERIEHVAVELGDGAGFDVRSFETNGRDRLIEVKTTRFGKETPFFLTRNEVSVSRERKGVYFLYRVFGFRDDPRLFMKHVALDRTCVLDPIQFMARSA